MPHRKISEQIEVQDQTASEMNLPNIQIRINTDPCQNISKKLNRKKHVLTHSMKPTLHRYQNQTKTLPKKERKRKL